MSVSASTAEVLPALRSVGDHVRAAHRRRVAACALEALLVGGSAGCVCVAAAIVSRSTDAAGQAWCVALLGAGCAAGSWWLERRPEPALVARELDRKLGAEGAILTAFELRDAARVSDIGLLLAARAARVLEQGARVARSALVSIPLLVLALVGIALLAYALDARHAGATSDTLLALAERVEQDAQGLRSIAAGEARASERAAEQRAQLAALVETSASLRAAARTAASDPEQLRTNASKLTEQLAALAPRLARDVEQRSAWTQLAASVDALQAELARTAPSVERARSADVPTPGRERANGNDPAAQARERAGTSAPTDSGSNARATGADAGSHAASARVPSDAPGVTLSAPHSTSGAVAPAPPPTTSSVEAAGTGALPSRPEGGLTSGSWWPRNYDAVVERWVEAQRAARNHPPQ